MKLTIPSDVLADAVTWTARAIPARPAAPVLAGILLTADGSTLTAKAERRIDRLLREVGNRSDA